MEEIQELAAKNPIGLIVTLISTVIVGVILVWWLKLGSLFESKKHVKFADEDIWNQYFYFLEIFMKWIQDVTQKTKDFLFSSHIENGILKSRQ